MKKRDGLVLLIIIAIDQISKILIFNSKTDNLKVIDNFFYISKVENSGAAWGAFSGKMWLFYIVSVVALYFLYKIYRQSYTRSAYFRYSIVLMMAGTIGNFIDRLMFGYVRDFLNFFILGYDYPVFNVADMSLVIGVGLVILYLIKNPHEELL